jgi:hypothetical protein
VAFSRHEATAILDLTLGVPLKGGTFKILGRLAKVLKDAFAIAQAEPVTPLVVGVSVFGRFLRGYYIMGTISWLRR